MYATYNVCDVATLFIFNYCRIKIALFIAVTNIIVVLNNMNHFHMTSIYRLDIRSCFITLLVTAFALLFIMPTGR